MGVIKLNVPNEAAAGEPADAVEPVRLQEVLDVAAKLFHERGYKSTSLADIGQVLGMNKASLYYYVRSKEDLLRRLILRASKRLRDISRHPDLDTLAPAEALKKLVYEHCAVILEYPNELGLLIHQRKFVEQRTASEISERERAYVANVRGIIARGVEQGVFRALDVRTATSLTLDAINGLLRWYRSDGQLTAAEVIEATWRFIHGGLTAGAARQKKGHS